MKPCLSAYVTGPLEETETLSMSHHRSPLGRGAFSPCSPWLLGLLSVMIWAFVCRPPRSLCLHFALSEQWVMWSDGLAFALALLGAMLAIVAVGRPPLLPLVRALSMHLLGLAMPPGPNRLSSRLQEAFDCGWGVFVLRTSAYAAESAWLVVGKAVPGSRTLPLAIPGGGL